MDYGEQYADKAIAKTAGEIKRTYRIAQRELKRKLSDFEARFAAKDRAQRQRLAEGEITQQQYRNWLTGQVFMRNQWQSKIKEVSAVMHDCNKQAVEAINNRRLDVFAENYNFLAFKGEGSTGISFGIYNSQAVAKLLLDDPQILPKWDIDKEKDYEWNAEKVNNIVRQGIIQGESVRDIANRLTRDLSAKNENKMLMFARTAMTEAQNAGRQQQMNDAADMGIEILKKWIATMDSRTRDSHRALDGEEVPYNENFSNDLEYPGDPAGDPAETYNCRCTMVSVYPEYEDRSKADIRRAYGEYEDADGEMHRFSYLTNDPEVYQEWKEAKQRNGYIIPRGMDYSRRGIYSEIGGIKSRPERKDYKTYDEFIVARDRYYKEKKEQDEKIRNWVLDNFSREITQEEFSAWMKKMGVVQYGSLDGLDKRALYAYTKRYNMLISDFPMVKEYHDKIGYPFEIAYDASPNYNAFANSGITFGNKYNDLVSGIVGEYRLRGSYFVKGADPVNVEFDHEFGHQVYYALQEKNREFAESRGEDANKARLEFDNEIWGSLSNKEGCSEYSMTKTRELFAEGFAAWYGGENTEFSRAMLDLLERHGAI